jgi:hypothetical protein
MQKLIQLATVFTLLASTATAIAQKLTEAFITVKEVDVRSGAAEQFPATGKLQQNDRVEIRREVNSGTFLEIVPPSGSFSWVRDKDVQAGDMENGRAVLIVSVPETTLRAGAVGNGQPLIANSAIVKRGGKLFARGDKATVAIEKESWWPVDCVADEPRFIPASAVQRASASRDVPSLPRPGSTTANESPRWIQADQAQREGRLDDAERLFSDIVRDTATSGKDFELSLRAQNRIREIRLQRRTQLTSRPSGNDGKYIPPQQGIPSFTPPAERMPPRPSLPTPASLTGRTTPRDLGNGRWESSGTGYLRRSGFQIDGRQTYALETANGQLRIYVTAEPGVDLESHLNRHVELVGMFEMRGDVRGANYMRAARVLPVR